MENNLTISISRNLNEMALSLINISNLYENNLNSVKMICLLDETLNNQFIDTSSIIFNTFKYIIKLEYEAFRNQKINYKVIKNKLKHLTVIEKKTSYRTLAFIILEIIILINDSIDNEKVSKDFFLNFAQSFYKLYIFEKKYLDSNLLKEIIEETFSFENLID